MSYSVILHVAGETAILGEVDELPKPADNIIIISNPRQRDGKDLHYINNNVARVIWPIQKVNFIEILDNADEEKIVGFVRD
jgi:hypothetical protein